jgi:hypothetical protein
MKLDRGLWIFGALSIFLSLAPFLPEPHLIGKIRWVMGGAVGMQPADYFDLFLHAGPLVVFLFMLGLTLGKQFKTGA